jgi:hypothetical protein
MKSQKTTSHTNDNTTTDEKTGSSSGPTNPFANYDSQLQEWSQKLAEFKDQLTLLGLDLQSEASEKISELEKKYTD